MAETNQKNKTEATLAALMERVRPHLRGTRLNEDIFATQATIALRKAGRVFSDRDYAQAIYDCAVMGMYPNIHALIQEYKGKNPHLKVQIMATGVRDFVARIPGCHASQPQIVREGDEYSLDYHLSDEKGMLVPKLHFKPVAGNDGPVVCVFLVYKRPVDQHKPDGEFYTDVIQLDKEYLDRVSETGRSSNTWNQWTDEMYKKTAILRLLKVMPGISPEIVDKAYDASGLPKINKDDDESPPRPDTDKVRDLKPDRSRAEAKKPNGGGGAPLAPEPEPNPEKETGIEDDPDDIPQIPDDGDGEPAQAGGEEQDNNGLGEL